MRGAGKPISSVEVNGEKKVFTAGEACRALGVSRPTLSRLTKARKIAFYRVGKRILFAENHITDFLRSCEVRPQNSQAA
jgi:excisionase family DNA binding protein